MKTTTKKTNTKRTTKRVASKPATKRTSATSRTIKMATEVKVFSSMPKGWKEQKYASNPKGAKWISNGESRFAKDSRGKSKFKQALLITDKELFNEKYPPTRKPATRTAISRTKTTAKASKPVTTRKTPVKKTTRKPATKRTTTSRR